MRSSHDLRIPFIELSLLWGRIENKVTGVWCVQCSGTALLWMKSHRPTPEGILRNSTHRRPSKTCCWQWPGFFVYLLKHKISWHINIRPHRVSVEPSGSKKDTAMALFHLGLRLCQRSLWWSEGNPRNTMDEGNNAAAHDWMAPNWVMHTHNDAKQTVGQMSYTLCSSVFCLLSCCQGSVGYIGWGVPWEPY